MDHLEFVDKINETGVSIRGTNVEDKENEFVIYDIFNNPNTIIEKNGQLRWKDKDERDPFTELIKMAIDIDGYKYSWHNVIKPDNYEKFIEIIQDKILDRAEQIKTLLNVYFQIKHEISIL